jgi:hypothetical protein
VGPPLLLVVVAPADGVGVVGAFCGDRPSSLERTHDVCRGERGVSQQSQKKKKKKKKKSEGIE